MCGGAAIHPHYIITLASCFDETEWPTPPDEGEDDAKRTVQMPAIRIGESTKVKLGSRTLHEGIDVPFDQIIVHENYTGYGLHATDSNTTSSHQILTCRPSGCYKLSHRQSRPHSHNQQNSRREYYRLKSSAAESKPNGHFLRLWTNKRQTGRNQSFEDGRNQGETFLFLTPAVGKFSSCNVCVFAQYANYEKILGAQRSPRGSYFYNENHRLVTRLWYGENKAKSGPKNVGRIFRRLP